MTRLPSIKNLIADNCQTPKYLIEYFNTGDTYTPTVMRINKKSWFIGCWGDTVESLT